MTDDTAKFSPDRRKPCQVPADIRPMGSDDIEIGELTSLLGQCLGRIDEQAYRLQTAGCDGEHDQIGDVLEAEAARLQELVGSLLVAHGPDVGNRSRLDRAVQNAVQATLDSIGFPVVVRQRLAPGLPQVACGQGQLAYALQRSLLLAANHAGSGGEVTVETRAEEGTVVFELQACGSGREPDHFAERAATLQDFVDECGGRCLAAVDDQGQLLLSIELPAAPPEGDSVGG